MDLNTCPEDRDQTAEAFVMRSLAAQERTVFAAHLMTCADCRQSVQIAEDFIAAMGEATFDPDEDDDDLLPN